MCFRIQIDDAYNVIWTYLVCCYLRVSYPVWLECSHYTVIKLWNNGHFWRVTSYYQNTHHNSCHYGHDFDTRKFLTTASCNSDYVQQTFELKSNDSRILYTFDQLHEQPSLRRVWSHYTRASNICISLLQT